MPLWFRLRRFTLMQTLRPVITCEHGGNHVPPPYRAALRPLAWQLTSHRGYDPGALPLAKALATELSAPLFASTVTRLLVDLNRSPRHPALHSPPVRALPADRRAAIVRAFYRPHRDAVEAAIRSCVERGDCVLHLAVHSFTPMLGGKRRNADIGLLYDPRRPAERHFCAELRDALKSADPRLRVRFNYPYLGTSDGLSTALRRRFSEAQYLGIELEMNQRFSAAPRRRRIARALLQALTDLHKIAQFRAVGRRMGGRRSNGSGRRARRGAAP